MWPQFWIVFSLGTLALAKPVWGVQDPKVPVDLAIRRVGEMTHIEISGRKEWDYQLKKVSDGYTVLLPPLTSQSQEALLRYHDLLVKAVNVKGAPGQKSQLHVVTQDPGIESFDYLTQEPSRLIIDFYAKDDKLLAKLRKQASEQAKSTVVHAESKKAKKTSAQGKNSKRGLASSKEGLKNQVIDRRPAFSEFLFTEENTNLIKDDTAKISDYEPNQRFEKYFDFSFLKNNNDNSQAAKVIEARGNIYLRFPMLRLPNRHLKELEKYPPSYKIKESFSDENKQARFLETLFNRKSYASFIKAKGLFKKNFPASKYDEILDYMEADSWVALWKDSKSKGQLEKAIDLYKKITERNPASRLAERSQIFIALLAHEEMRYFEAGKLLKRYLTNYPQSPFREEMKIYMADTLAQLNNYDGALKIYSELRKSERPEISIEAQFRKADIYFLQKEYRKAEKNYNLAMGKNPNHQGKFPNAWFNTAESLFNLADYQPSLNAFKNFYQKFPSHPYSAFALTRIGELVDILSGDRSKAQGFYNESVFRFPASEGAAIAKIRSLSQRFPKMKSSEIEYSINEINNKATMITLDHIDEFAAFMVSDGHYWRGEFQKAIDTLIGYFQKDPNPVHMSKFVKRISRSIAGELRDLVQKHRPIQALQVIQDHEKSWLSKSGRVDVQFYRARSIEQMGLFDKAQKSYLRLLARLKKLEGSKEEKERKVFEYYPTQDQIYTRVAVTQFEKGLKDEVVASLKQVEKPLGLDDSDRQDYFLTLSKLEYGNKNYQKAKELMELVKDIPILKKEKRDKVYVYLSSVYEKNREFDKALALLENYYNQSKKLEGGDNIYILSRLFNLYKGKGFNEKAIQTGEELLAKYSKDHDLDKERYDLGELYFNQKNTKRAQKVWKDLKKKGVWTEVAKNKMEAKGWKSSTREKLDRIPAMKR